MYISSCLFSLMSSGLLVTPGVSCLSALSCPALSSLKTIVYVLVCVSLFLPRVCTVTEDQTKTVSFAPSPRFVFVFESLYFVPVSLFMSVPRQGSRHSSSRHSPLQDGVGVRRDRRESVGRDARRSREISAAGGGSPKPAGGLPSSRVATPPGTPFAGDHATGPPLTQCPPARL